MALSHLTAIRSPFIAMKSVFAYFAYFSVCKFTKNSHCVSISSVK